MAGKKRQKQSEIIERRAAVAKIRLSGERDQSAIAAKLGVDQSTISRDFKALDAQWVAAALGDTAAHKGLELARTEALIGAHWEKAMAGKGFDTDRVLAAMQHKAKLLGLEAAAKQEIELDFTRYEIVGVSDGELAGVITPAKEAP